MKQRPRIGVDFDDVLVDFVGTFINWHNRTYGTRAKITDHRAYPFSSSLGINEEQSTERVRQFTQTELYPRLPALKGARELLEGLQPYAETVIVTARHERNAIPTRHNADLHFSGLIKHIIHAPRLDGPTPDIAKAQVCAREGLLLLIDDNHDNLSHCATHTPRVPGIVYTRPWNDTVRCDSTYRAHTHEEILDHALKVLGVRHVRNPVSLVLAPQS